MLSSHSSPNISFILPVYNGLKFTQECISSFENTVFRNDFEFLIGDNGSYDRTRNYLASLDKNRYKIFFNEENLYYAGNVNKLASQARGKFLVILNNDLILTSNWLEPLLQVFNSSQDVGIVGNIQINPANKCIDHAGVFFDLKGLPMHARNGSTYLSKHDYKEWNAVTAACIAIKRATFNYVDGFDVTYRNGFEDIDLCLRLKLLGYRHFVSNKSVIFHHLSQAPDRKKFNQINCDIFYKRWNHITVQWGSQEWPGEYMKLHLKELKKIKKIKFLKAIYLFIKQTFVKGFKMKCKQNSNLKCVCW